jgi:hypothetical protein
MHVLFRRIFMRRSITVVVLITGLCLSLNQKADAAGLCCQLSSGVQESLSGVAAPGSDELSLQFNYSFTKMDKFKEGSTTRSLDYVKENFFPRYTSLPVEMDMFKYTMTAGYGFSSRLKAFISIPYVRNTMDMTRGMTMMMTTTWMDMTMEPVKGMGDVTAMALYRLYTNRDIRPTDVVTLGLGVKAPTGSFTETNSNGKFVHAHMQPGTGSWDPLLSLIYTKMIDQFLLQTDATYQYATRNREGYEFGNSAALNLTGKYAVIKEFNVAAGLTYLYVGRASDKDGNYTNLTSLMDDPANTGGESLWFSPGVQILPFRNGMIDIKYQVPIWEKVNGIQLVTSYRLLLGVSYNF